MGDVAPCKKILNLSRLIYRLNYERITLKLEIKGGSNMTRTDLYVNKPHCAAAVRP